AAAGSSGPARSIPSRACWSSPTTRTGTTRAGWRASPIGRWHRPQRRLEPAGGDGRLDHAALAGATRQGLRGPLGDVTNNNDSPTLILGHTAQLGEQLVDQVGAPEGLHARLGHGLGDEALVAEEAVAVEH